MNTIEGYWLITPDDLAWRPSNLMRIPNADYLERTGSENLGARLWRMPPKSANTLHKHVFAGEFYFVLEGVGRLRFGKETLTVPCYGGVLVGPAVLRQGPWLGDRRLLRHGGGLLRHPVGGDVLWLIVGAPDNEFPSGAIDMKLIYPEDPTKLPPELKGFNWPGDAPRSVLGR